MKKRILMYLLIFVTAILIGACREDDDFGPLTDEKKLAKVFVDDTLTQEFIYEGEKLIRVYFYSRLDPGGQATMDLKYDGQDRVYEMNTREFSSFGMEYFQTYSIEYDSMGRFSTCQVVRSSPFYVPNISSKTSIKLLYNSDSSIYQRLDTTWNYLSTIMQAEVAEFGDDGNITHFESTTRRETPPGLYYDCYRDMVYDTMKTPYSDFWKMIFDRSAANNLLEYSHYNSCGSEVSTHFRNETIYHSFGYPKKIITFYGDDVFLTTTYQYYD